MVEQKDGYLFIYSFTLPHGMYKFKEDIENIVGLDCAEKWPSE